MTRDFVSDAVRGSNRRLLIWSILGVAVIVVGLAASANYYYNVFNGPFPVSQEQLLSLSDLSKQQQYWVTVKGDDVIDTGFELVSRNTRTGSETVEANYTALVLGERLLLVKTASLLLSTEYTGSLAPIPTNVRNEVLNELERDEPQLQGVFLPYMLDTGDFKTSGYIGLAVGAVILLASLWGLLRLMQRRSDPLKHPIMRSLQRFGDAQAIAQQVNTDLGREHPAIGSVHFTPNWIVQLGGSSLNATRPTDLMWVYKRVTQRRAYGVPAGRSFATLIWDRHGTCITFAGKENQVNQAIEGLLQRAPWVVAGYSREVEKAWQKDRAGFVAAVDERRRQSATTRQ